jgi:hypothetical protein
MDWGGLLGSMFFGGMAGYGQGALDDLIREEDEAEKFALMQLQQDFAMEQQESGQDFQMTLEQGRQKHAEGLFDKETDRAYSLADKQMEHAETMFGKESERAYALADKQMSHAEKIASEQLAATQKLLETREEADANKIVKGIDSLSGMFQEKMGMEPDQAFAAALVFTNSSVGGKGKGGRQASFGDMLKVDEQAWENSLRRAGARSAELATQEQLDAAKGFVDEEKDGLLKMAGGVGGGGFDISSLFGVGGGKGEKVPDAVFDVLSLRAQGKTEEWGKLYSGMSNEQKAITNQLASVVDMVTKGDGEEEGTEPAPQGNIDASSHDSSFMGEGLLSPVVDAAGFQTDIGSATAGAIRMIQRSPEVMQKINRWALETNNDVGQAVMDFASSWIEAGEPNLEAYANSADFLGE